MGVYEYDSQNQELKRMAGGTLYADLPIGSEIEYAGTTAPTGFLKCDGSTYSQITYPELYAILGTTTLPNKSGYIIKAKQIGVPADFASAIEDVIDEKFSYSTSEVNTGKKWIDGKDIYSKVLTCTTTISLNVNSWTEITNYFSGITFDINVIIKANNVYFNSDDGNNLIYDNVWYRYDATNHKLYATAQSTSVTFNANHTSLIIEYTKTTD